MNRNNLFYICSLLESISRKTGLKKKEIIDKIGLKQLKHLYNYADVNHCLPILQVTEEVIESNHLPVKEIGTSQTVSVWDNGKVYQRLIIDISDDSNWFDKLIGVYHSWICDYLDNTELPIYWQPRSYIRECYLEKKIL